MKKILKMTLGAVCMAGLLALPFQASAISLTIGDSYYLGSVNPGVPAGETHEEGYIDQLRGMAAPSGPSLVGGQTYTRSGNAFGIPDGANLPAADFATKYEDDSDDFPPLPSFPFTLPGEFVYLLAKYGVGGPTGNQVSHIWVISGLDEVELDESALSHISLFNRGGDITVPDGGATALLLGAAMAGFAALRRRLA